LRTWRVTAMFERAPDPVSVCRELRWGNPSKRIPGKLMGVVAGKPAHATADYVRR
jgi:hypothetical protein